MKRITNYIIEKLQIGSNTKLGNNYNYCPKTRDELYDLIEKLIEKRGNEADLNDIDVSKITDMALLFYESDFNGDISQWDVSKVTNMGGMFVDSKFNGDISKWDVSNVTNMNSMFYDSKFNRDIFDWDVSNVTDMEGMFKNSPLEKNPPKWYKE